MLKYVDMVKLNKENFTLGIFLTELFEQKLDNDSQLMTGHCPLK